MDETEDSVAIGHAGGNDAQGQQVVDLVHGNLRLLQLLVDAVKALDAPLDAGLDIVLAKLLHQQPLDSIEELLTLFAARLNRLVHLLVGEWIDVAEGEVFELAAHLAHAQAMGERSVDVEGFASNTLLLLRREMLKRAHVVQAIGQLDQHHAHIADHGQQHLANVFRLAIFAVGELNLVDLGHALDDVLNLLAKFCANLLGLGLRVFDCVVQQTSSDGGRIELHLRQNERDFKRVQNKRLARGPHLALVMFETEIPGFADDIEIVAGTVGAHQIEQFAELVSKQIRTLLSGQRGGLGGCHVSLYAL